MASPALADDFALGLREDYTLTDSRWEWGGPVAREGVRPSNRYATVKAQGVKAWVTTVTLDAAWRRWLLSGEAGLGPVVNGTLSHASANSWYHDTRSWIDDGRQTSARALLGYRLLDRPSWNLDGLVGASYHRNEVVAAGAVGWPLGTLADSNRQLPAILHTATETTTWVSVLVALRASLRLTDNIALSGEAHGTPWSWVRFEEERPQRPGADSPASVGEATGGWGAGGRIGAHYRLLGDLWLTGGMTYDYLQSGRTWGFHYRPLTPDCRQPRCQPVRFEMRTTTQSWGPYLGVEYRWSARPRHFAVSGARTTSQTTGP